MDISSKSAYRNGSCAHPAAAAGPSALPQTLGLAVEEADIVARRVEGDIDDAELQSTEIDIFYPGQVTYRFLHDDFHPGKPSIQETELGVRDQHDLETLPGFKSDSTFHPCRESPLANEQASCFAGNESW